MSYVIGLGNPGERYRGTRHNVGFEVVDELARRRGIRLERELCGALVGGREDLDLAKPLTYMNRSGYAVRCLLERAGEEPSNALVVYDDVNLELGRLRMRPGGSPGGHRGMESIVQNLRTTDVPRLRLGVGSGDSSEELADFVLSPFSPEEAEAAEAMVVRAADAVETWLADGVEVAMNEHNAPEVGRS